MTCHSQRTNKPVRRPALHTKHTDTWASVAAGISLWGDTMTGNPDRISRLKNFGLFRDFSPDELNDLAQVLQERTYPPFAMIVKEGTIGNEMFFIKDGRVDVKKREISIGMDLTVATMESGDCFGEMSLLTDRPRSATVQATESLVELMVLQKHDFMTLLHRHPFMSIRLNKVLAERIEEVTTQKGVTFVPLSKLNLDSTLLNLIPYPLITRHHVLPIAYFNNTLTLGMVTPHDILALDEVRKFVKGVAIEPVAISDGDLQRFLKNDFSRLSATDPKSDEGQKNNTADEIKGDRGYDAGRILDTIDAIQSDILKEIEIRDEREENSFTDLQKEAQGAPIIRLTNSIIALALKRGASDIHLEPLEKGLRVRCRVDGVLQEEQTLPKRAQLPLVSRIKIISKLDITERRLPQDGRITVKLDTKSVDFRVSTMPAKFGEKVAIRILDKGGISFNLDNFITDGAVLATVREMIKRPYGIIYVTGPTGSGKTTTLYSALSELNRPEVNISTIEDPIEYDLEGINQVQVNPDIGLDFARVLRAFLRQDPDIILLGETRDQETAKIAVEAALTGHLVFTTLHANDAFSTCIRLIEMGVEPFLIATSIIGVIAQRLVRRICGRCREPYTPDGDTIRYLDLPPGSQLYRGRGCEVCGYSGYQGRVGIFEVMKVTEGISHLIARQSDTQAIRREAVKGGMKTLRDYANTLLLQGQTTVDEVLRTVAIQY